MHRTPEQLCSHCQRPLACRPVAEPRHSHSQHRHRHARPALAQSCSTESQPASTASCAPTAPQYARRALLQGAGLLAVSAAACQQVSAAQQPSNFEPMEALKSKDYGKSRFSYPDYIRTDSGLQYKDVREGSGQQAQRGSRVSINWDGYTIGYYGRPFQGARFASPTKSGEKGEQEQYSFRVGDNAVIPAFEEAILGMRQGGVRRIVVPVELGYPDNDLNRLGPKPTTFSGVRALDFVLKNKGLIDKTLLFDIELIRIT